MTEPIPIDDLTFGIELEVILPRSGAGRDGLAAAMVEAGLSARHEHYNHATRTWWKITTDASIGSENAEVVSPILRGPDGFRQVGLACQALTTFGCRVNRTTGFHVHVGVADRFGERLGFFKELVRTYAKFEPIIDQLMAPSRRARQNSYCAPVTFDESMERATTIRDLRYAYGTNRFRKLNLEAFAAHGTVEFRQHQGTTSSSKIENWVRLCLRMVAHAAKNTERESNGSERPRQPMMPPEPRFDDARDLAASPAIRVDQLSRGNVRTYGRSWVISRVARFNPRRSGTAGHANWSHYEVGLNLRAYVNRAGGLNHLRWDVEHGYVTVVNEASAPVVSVVPGSDEDERRARLRRAWRAQCDEIRRRHEDELLTYAAGQRATPAIERPATDAAPLTLDGLLDLINAADAERAFFLERQLELNS